MTNRRFLESALVHIHFYIADKRIPDHTISSYRDIYVLKNGSFVYEGGDAHVIEQVEPDTHGQERFYQQHIRLPVSPAHALELALVANGNELASATDDFIIGVMQHRFAPALFKDFLEENGWSDMGVGVSDGLYVFAHPDFPPRQIIYARTSDPEMAKYVSEDINDMVRKYAEITKRPELGVRLELIRREKVSY